MAPTQVPASDPWLFALAPLAGWPDAAAPRVSRLARLWTRFRSWHARRATERVLASLDRDTLKDLGIAPSEIASLVHGEHDRTRRYDESWWRRR
ncbi:MAG: hypothetical protein BroJett030_26670 [Alphaproteobacteria bacterium]|nr:MAG: hypothetical protein BroJett030_26670 [Alphaproteobacteria bacterium]